ncbi:MAG TPA: class I SAM-dependent methyltransferase [Vicinamibacterales bacterium]|nr:class I SAM-dependent methyltransferase [Vicinamibacterales bacterium]
MANAPLGDHAADTPRDPDQSIEDVYADWSDDYDLVFRPPRLVEAHGAWVVATLAALGARTVTDVAAGTGAQALALVESRRFDRVVCSDASKAMLGRCQAKLAAPASRAPGTRVAFRHGDWRSIHIDPALTDCDIVICLGDSLTHGASTADLEEAFASWWRILRPGGRVLVDYGVPFATQAAAIRRGEFRAPESGWAIKERHLSPGCAHVLAIRRNFEPSADAPLGWMVRSHVLKAVFGTPTRATAHTLQYLVLDRAAVESAARRAGFSPRELPCGPSPRLGLPVEDALFQKC